MAPRRYEISLRVLKIYSMSEGSERVKYFSRREDKIRISKRPIYHINTNEMPNQFEHLR